MVELHDADGPGTGELVPDFVRYLGSNPASAVRAGDEEFGNVPGGLAGGGGWEVGCLLLDQNEPRPMAVDFDEKRMSAWGAPVARQVRVAVPTVGA